MDDAKFNGGLSIKKMADMVRSNLDLNLFEKEKGLLNELRSEYMKASKMSKEAGDEVRFLDKLNIFSDSPEEIKRNAAENVKDVYGERIDDKKSQLRKMIQAAIPPQLKAAGLLRDLQNQLGQIDKSIGRAMNESKRVSSELRGQYAKLNQPRAKKIDPQKSGPKMANIYKLSPIRSTDTLNSHLQGASIATKSAKETFSSLLKYLKLTSMDLPYQLGQIDNSIGIAMNESERVSSELREQYAKLNQPGAKRIDPQKSGPKMATINKLGPIKRVNTDTLHSHLQDVNIASKRAEETFSSLLKYIKQTSKDSIQPMTISFEDLINNMIE